MSKSSAQAQQVRRQVAAAYGEYATRGRSCCGSRPAGGACNLRPQALGYTAADLAALPQGVTVPSFGCGNPLAFSEVAPGDTVIDLGSGAGFDLLVAAERVAPDGHVIGIDMTEEMIAQARRNVAAAGHENVEVRQGLIEDMPVESGTADWVISNCVINLSPEKDRVFAEIARVLKPGGRMLVSDLVAEDPPAWLRESAAAFTACVGGAVSEREYVAGLREAGLVDVEVQARHTYRAADLQALLGTSGDAAAALADAIGCAGGGRDAPTLLQELDGKISSIKVFARKP